MFLEALSALADDLSYTQDRIAAEASLEFATQRRSVVRMARLVDYRAQPRRCRRRCCSSSTSTPGDHDACADGLPVTAPGPDGTPIPFETGASLAGRQINPSTDLPQVPPPTVSSAWNRGAICPYWFDDSQRCLQAGSTQMYVLGSGFHFSAGQSLLIETAPATIADPPIRQIVQLLDAGTEECDPLYPPAGGRPAPAGDAVLLGLAAGDGRDAHPLGRRGRPDGRPRPDPHDDGRQPRSSPPRP